MSSGLRMLVLDGLHLSREDVDVMTAALPQLWMLKLMDSHVSSGETGGKLNNK